MQDEKLFFKFSFLWTPFSAVAISFKGTLPPCTPMSRFRLRAYVDALLGELFP